MSEKGFNPKSRHLGDGAYIRLDGYGGVIVTANHHEIDAASDRVYIDSSALRQLAHYMRENELGGLEYDDER